MEIVEFKARQSKIDEETEFMNAHEHSEPFPNSQKRRHQVCAKFLAHHYSNTEAASSQQIETNAN